MPQAESDAPRSGEDKEDPTVDLVANDAEREEYATNYKHLFATRVKERSYKEDRLPWPNRGSLRLLQDALGQWEGAAQEDIDYTTSAKTRGQRHCRRQWNCSSPNQ